MPDAAALAAEPGPRRFPSQSYCYLTAHQRVRSKLCVKVTLAEGRRMGVCVCWAQPPLHSKTTPFNSTSSRYTIQTSLSAKCLCVCACIRVCGVVPIPKSSLFLKSRHMTHMDDDDAHSCFHTLPTCSCHSTEEVEPDRALETAS